MMQRIRLVFPLLTLALPLLPAVESGWRDKAISDWTQADAQSFLAGSPWVKSIKPSLLHGLSEDQRRAGGNMEAEGGGKTGVNHSGLETTGSVGHADMNTSLEANNLPASIAVRWESALPVRVAEIKSRNEDAMELDGEEYAIAVVDVPLKGAMYNLDLKILPTVLKQNAVLKEEGKRDLKPSRVVLRQNGSSIATIIYFFPRSAHITTDDKRLLFTALVGRLFLSQYFFPPEMLLQGKLEL